MSTVAAPPAGRVSPVLIDALLGTGVFLAISLIIAAEQGGARSPDVLAYLFAAGFGALMLARRPAPRLVIVATVVLMFGYYTLDYPPIGVAVPVVAALFSAADAGLMAWSVWAGLAVFGTSLVFRLHDGEAPGFLFGYEAVSNLALIAAAIALGDALRTRRRSAAAHAEVVALTAQRAARDTADRMRRERERISRDLHDTVGHTMSVICLQAGVAADAIGGANPAAATAVEKIRTMSSATLTDLRWLVRALRRDAGEHPAPAGPRARAGGPVLTEPAAGPEQVLSLSAVPALARATHGAGLAVDTAIHPDLHAGGGLALPPPVDAAAFRIVQEALTNAVRHSGARHVSITAAPTAEHLALTVTDDGSGVADPQPGNGLAGMAERVRLLGGQLRIDSAPGAGFTVHARLPIRLAP